MSEKFSSSSNDNQENLKKSIAFLINLLSTCVERGGFTLSDAVKINDSISVFTNNDKNIDESINHEELQTNSIQNIINYINLSQSKGKLTLEEAYEAYISINSFK